MGMQDVFQPTKELPVELRRLRDSNAPVQLPTNIAPGALCNKELDILVNCLGRCKKTWRRAILLYDWLLSIRHKPDDRLCTSLIRICSQNGQHAQALDIYGWMRTPQARGGGGLTPTVYTYTVAMRAALDGNVMDTAVEIWEEVQRVGMPADSYLCCAYMETCMKLGQLDKVMWVYNNMKAHSDAEAGPPVHAYTIAMRAATACAEPGKALDIWGELMSRRDIKPSGHAYTAAIGACAAACDATRAQQLFDDMLSRRIRPDVVSCTALISALGADKQWQRCESVLVMMRTWGLSPNARTYSALIAALANAQQWHRALSLLQAMNSAAWQGPAANAYTYSAVIKCLGENGQFELAEMVFAQLEAAECPNSAYDLPRCRPISSPDDNQAASNRVSSGAAASTSDATAPSPPETSGSLRGLQEAVLDGFSMHRSASFTSLFSTDDDLSSARSQSSVLSVASASSQDSLAGSWSPLFGAGKPSSAIPQDGRDTDVAVFPTDLFISVANDPLPSLPKRTSSRSRIKRVTACTNDDKTALQQRPPYLSPAELTLQIVRSKSSTERCERRLEHPEAGIVVEQLTLPGVPAPTHRRDATVNEVVCGALMHAYERAGMWREAVAVLGRARLLGIQPNTIMYNTAISAAGRAGQATVAQALFDGVPQRDAVTYESLIAAYGSAGEPDKAEATFDAMLTHRLEPHDYAYVGLIAGHSLKGDLRSALAVWKRMLKQGQSPTVHVMNALIVACESQGRYEKAIDVFLELKRDGVVPNQYTQEILSQVCKKQYSNIEAQQATAAALSAAAAAVGTVLIRSGVI